MKLICPLSGVPFSVSHFGSQTREYGITHPIFELPVSTLLSRTTDFFNGKLSPLEKRLLFLAVLNSSKLIEWRSMANPSDATITANFERLAKTIGWLDLYSWDGKSGRRIGPAFPKFAITKDTKQLLNIPHWLDTWYDARVAYENGSRRENILERIARRERALQKMIMNPHMPREKRAYMLAQWVADATDFPTGEVKIVDGEGNVKITTKRDYWISLITEPNPYGIPEHRLEQLLNYLLDNLEHGSIFAHDILTLVRKKLSAAHDNLGIGEDIGLSQEEIDKIYNSPFRIVPIDGETETTSEDSLLVENTQILSSGAPTKEPVRQEYKTQVEFMTARAKWILSKHARKDVK